jgi:phosphoglycolate phosphatase-like HAD superfamily hydrolase
MQGQWMSINEYSRLTNTDQDEVQALIMRGKLQTTIQDDEVLVDASSIMANIVPSTLQELSDSQTPVTVGANFVEKTIGTIINLHEKVLFAKEETIESIKNENMFLREALDSLQELYDEDRRTIATLTESLKLTQQAVEFMRRKYKLMWGKVIEDHATQ